MKVTDISRYTKLVKDLLGRWLAARLRPPDKQADNDFAGVFFIHGCFLSDECEFLINPHVEYTKDKAPCGANAWLSYSTTFGLGLGSSVRFSIAVAIA